MAAAHFAPAPIGFRAEDLVPLSAVPDGFLPFREAAEEMGLPLGEFLELVETGKLEVFLLDGVVLYVRPAILSVLQVPGGKGLG